jgi:hypothetical protein
MLHNVQAISDVCEKQIYALKRRNTHAWSSNHHQGHHYKNFENKVQ